MIEIATFKGMMPIVPPRLLPIQFAQSANNCDLSRGILIPFHDVSATKTLNTTAWKSIFPVKSGATTFWMCSEQEAHFVHAPVHSSGERFYYTDGVRSMESNYALASDSGDNTYGAANETYYLGVPKPSDALTVAVKGDVGTSGDLALKDVTGTFVDDEEIHLRDAVGESTTGYLLLDDITGTFEDDEDIQVVETTPADEGYLLLTDVVGTFENDEDINITGVKHALVNGTISGSYLAYDGRVDGKVFAIDDEITGGTSEATATIAGIAEPGIKHAVANGAVSNDYLQYDGRVSSRTFAVGDSIVGATSHATATVDAVAEMGDKYALANGTLSDGDYLSYDGLVDGKTFQINDDIIGGTSHATATIRSITETAVDSVSYIYTFVTDWGYEGEPSDPSDVTDVGPGQYVELGNFEIPVPEDYNIVGIRLYRTSSGSEETEFCFLSEAMTGDSEDYITPDEITDNDDVWNDKDSTDDELTDADDLGEVIACEDYIEPPSALNGLLALPNGVVVAYRTGREVYFSEPYIHYGFPDDSIVRVNYDIKAIGYYGTTVVVGTEGNPYKINGYDPQALAIEIQPDKQSCLYTRAMVSAPRAVYYISPDGLYRISEAGNDNVTKNIFTKEQWKDLLTTSTAYDKTVIGFYYDRKYYGFFEGSNSGFIINFESETQYYATFSLDSTYSVYGGYVDIEDDSLYLLVKVGSTYYIKKWEGSSDYLVCSWKSKIFTDKHTFYSCMKINGDVSSDSTGTGTITTTSTAISGSGTSFLTELKPGHVIYNADNDEYREVATVADNTSLTITRAFTTEFSDKAFKYNDILVNIYKDNSIFYTRAVNTVTPFRLPAGYGREWSFEIKGSDDVYSFKLGKSMIEL